VVVVVAVVTELGAPLPEALALAKSSIRPFRFSLLLAACVVLLGALLVVRFWTLFCRQSGQAVSQLQFSSTAAGVGVALTFDPWVLTTF